MRDIDGGFPSDSRPYAEDYDYVSDSDLEDTWEDGEEPQEDSDGNSQRRPENVEVKQTHQPTVSNNSPSDPSSIEEIKPQNDNRSTSFPVRQISILITQVPVLIITLQEWARLPLFAMQELLRACGAVSHIHATHWPTTALRHCCFSYTPTI